MTANDRSIRLAQQHEIAAIFSMARGAVRAMLVLDDPLGTAIRDSFPSSVVGGGGDIVNAVF